MAGLGTDTDRPCTCPAENCTLLSMAAGTPKSSAKQGKAPQLQVLPLQWGGVELSSGLGDDEAGAVTPFVTYTGCCLCAQPHPLLSTPSSCFSLWLMSKVPDDTGEEEGDSGEC